MKPSDNNLRQLVLGCIAPAAVILGAIAAYIGFIFDLNTLLAVGSLVATIAICPFMTPKKSDLK